MCSIAAGSAEGVLPEDRVPGNGVAADPAAPDRMAPGQVLQGGAEQRIAEIERAIDELANMAGPAGLGGTEPIVARVAELWGLLAELDPEVARRLAGYQALSAVPTQSELADRVAASRGRPCSPDRYRADARILRVSRPRDELARPHAELGGRSECS